MERPSMSGTRAHWALAATTIVIALLAAPAAAQQWQLIKIDSVPAANAAIDIDSQGRAHVLYCDTRYNESTREYTYGYTYAVWDGSGWEKHPFDDVSRSQGWSSLELDAQDRPHMAFYVHKQSGSDPGTVRYATMDGQGQCRVETAFADEAGLGLYPSLALDSQGRPCISHVGRYSWFDGSQWRTEHAVGGAIGYFTDLELDAQDRPHVTSVTITYAYPQYATRPQGTWQATQFMAPSRGSSGGTSLELDAAGRAHVAWWRTETCLPSLTWQTAQGDWQSTAPPEQSHLRSRYCDDLSLEFDATGRACLAYTWFIDDVAWAARYGIWDGQGWSIQTIADGMYVLGTDSFELDSAGRAHVLVGTYIGHTGEIYYAYIPEPAALSLLAVGVLALRRRGA